MTQRVLDTHAAASAPRPARLFTVMLPIHRPPDMLAHAVASVRVQTVADFELAVICDGAPPETAQAARCLAASDERICVFDLPKGARHGEAHRHAVLQGSRATFIAQVGDDDLWLPDHLATLSRLLEAADFVSTSQTRILPDGDLRPVPRYGDLRIAAVRTRMLETNWNFFGPSEAGYRLDAYRRLPEGWHPAPEGLPTDLHMWRKFLAHPGLRFASAHRATTLKLSALDWCNIPYAARERELADWAARLREPRAARRIAMHGSRLAPAKVSSSDLRALFWISPGAATVLALRALTYRARRALHRRIFEGGRLRGATRPGGRK